MLHQSSPTPVETYALPSDETFNNKSEIYNYKWRFSIAPYELTFFPQIKNSLTWTKDI